MTYMYKISAIQEEQWIKVTVNANLLRDVDVSSSNIAPTLCFTKTLQKLLHTFAGAGQERAVSASLAAGVCWHCPGQKPSARRLETEVDIKTLIKHAPPKILSFFKLIAHLRLLISMLIRNIFRPKANCSSLFC